MELVLGGIRQNIRASELGGEAKADAGWCRI